MGYTINDIARMTGLSRSTVSRVINDSEHVKKETREIVLGAIEELGYVPNMIARGLRTESRIIGVVTQDILNPYYIEALYEIEKLCREYGYALLHMNSDSNPDIEEHNIYYLLSMKVQGIIMLGNMLVEDTRIVRQARSTTHIITMEGIIDGVDGVISDPTDGITAMVEHLISLGHREIGLVHRGMRSFPIVDREKIFRKLMKKNGLEVAARNVFYGDDYIEQIHRAWDRERLPTALFTLNDSTAVSIYRWAQEQGLSIPKDLSLVGFDDVQSSEMLMPPLSTIRQPIGKLADIATRMLIDNIEKREPFEGRSVQRVGFGTQFILRGSTAIPRSG